MTDFLKYGNGHAFEAQPQFVNHMCHWAPWADHFQNDADTEKAALANMLGYALEELSRCSERSRKLDKSRCALLWAYIATVEHGSPIPLASSDESLSIGSAWASIQTLNRWRKENKLNISFGDA